jgi:predicted RNA-binding Zn-ribbon protein involved in translation (DUF1610 family)
MKLNENMEYCKTIADTLEAIINGDLYKCPECGEYVRIMNNCADEDFDLSCGHHTEYDLEEVTIFDYFEEVFDIEYRINAKREYKSVRLMVACGGPNIYIDTAAKAVQLYWWTERADYMLSDEVCNEIDAMFEELYNC